MWIDLIWLVWRFTPPFIDWILIIIWIFQCPPPIAGQSWEIERSFWRFGRLFFPFLVGVRDRSSGSGGNIILTDEAMAARRRERAVSSSYSICLSSSFLPFPFFPCLLCPLSYCDYHRLRLLTINRWNLIVIIQDGPPVGVLALNSWMNSTAAVAVCTQSRSLIEILFQVDFEAKFNYCHCCTKSACCCCIHSLSV